MGTHVKLYSLYLDPACLMNALQFEDSGFVSKVAWIRSVTETGRSHMLVFDLNLYSAIL